ncbi:MAG: phosphatidylglycerophosphatase A family protein, partial [Planctomycetota bacterium]
MSMPEPITAGGRVQVAVATVGGVGLIRPAPGTWGSLVAAVAVALVAVWAPGAYGWPLWVGAGLVATIACIWSCPAASRRFGRKDPGQVVIDEVAGVWIGAAVIPPALATAQPWLVAGVLFAVFRVLDIAKPWPIPRLERLPGGLGVAIDDV